MPIPLAHLGSLPHLHPHTATWIVAELLPSLIGAAALGGLLYALWRLRRSKATTSSSETWEKSSKNSPTA